MIDLAYFQIVSGGLFAVGLYGVLARRSAVLVLMSIELMLNAVNLNLIAAAAFLDPSRFTGLIIAIFVITVAGGRSRPGPGHCAANLPQQGHGEPGRDRVDEVVISTRIVISNGLLLNSEVVS